MRLKINECILTEETSNYVKLSIGSLAGREVTEDEIYSYLFNGCAVKIFEETDNIYGTPYGQPRYYIARREFDGFSLNWVKLFYLVPDSNGIVYERYDTQQSEEVSRQAYKSHLKLVKYLKDNHYTFTQSGDVIMIDLNIKETK